MAKKIRRKGFPDSVPELTPWSDEDGEAFEKLFIQLLDNKFSELNSVPKILKYVEDLNMLEHEGDEKVLRIDLLSQRFARTFAENIGEIT